MNTVITYGTFDLLHVGHVNLLRRARALGDRLVVGLSTDDFNQHKNKTAIVPYHDRHAMLQSLRFVDLVIPETGWDQKPLDIQEHGVKKFVMGHDWRGHFDYLQQYCEVVYLPRTADISTTHIKDLVHSRVSAKVVRLDARRA
jgi:glycerol-3-phosphate cytidylyltransferase